MDITIDIYNSVYFIIESNLLKLLNLTVYKMYLIIINKFSLKKKIIIIKSILYYIATISSQLLTNLRLYKELIII